MQKRVLQVEGRAHSSTGGGRRARNCKESTVAGAKCVRGSGKKNKVREIGG